MKVIYSILENKERLKAILQNSNITESDLQKSIERLNENARAYPAHFMPKPAEVRAQQVYKAKVKLGEPPRRRKVNMTEIQEMISRHIIKGGHVKQDRNGIPTLPAGAMSVASHKLGKLYPNFTCEEKKLKIGEIITIEQSRLIEEKRSSSSNQRVLIKGRS